VSPVPPAQPLSRARRAMAVALSAMLLMLAAPAGSSAAPWTASYGWQSNASTGYENWAADETVPNGGAPLPFYRTFLDRPAPDTIGRGLAIQPLGGRAYGNGGALSQEGGPGMILRWTAPGASRITRAQYDDLRYRNEGDGQYMRARVFGGVDETEDYGPGYGEDEPDQTYDNPSPRFDRSPPGGGTTAEFWLFTVCGPQSSGFACPNISSSTGTFARVGTVNLTLDDPDKPAVQVATDPDISDGWVNKKRAQRLSVSATDASSGIERIRIQATNSPTGSGGATILNQAVACDPLHRTPDRGGLNCPPTANASTTDPARAQGANGRTYTVTATDDAGNASDPVVRRIRYDNAKPTSASIGGDLERLLNRWTNRGGTVPVTVRASDALSGVARVELLAQRIAGGRPVSLGAADVACDGGECRSASERVNANLDAITRDGRYRLQIRATDRAGNVSKPIKVPGRLQIDREAPNAPSGYIQRSSDGRWFAYVRPGRDRGESSGPGSFELLYPTSPARVRTMRAAADGETVRTSRGWFRKVPLAGYEPVEGKDTFIVQEDQARNPSVQRKLVPTNFFKKAVCTVGGFFDPTGLVDLACKGFKDGVNNVVTRLCKGGSKTDQCAKAIEEICSRKVLKKVCGPVKKAACFLTELDQFCTKGQKKQKDAREAKKRLAAKIARLRQPVTLTIRGGTSRSAQKLAGRDGLNRATRNESTGITNRTVRYQREHGSSGQTRRGRDQTHNDPPGLKPGCRGFVRSHLLPRILGGTGDGRNITLLPASVNDEFSKGIEATIRRLVDGKNKVQIDVTAVANYSGNAPVPKSLTYTFIERDIDTGKPLRGRNQRTETVEVRDWDKVKNGCP
jgi:hypothetical protein